MPSGQLFSMSLSFCSEFQRCEQLGSKSSAANLGIYVVNAIQKSKYNSIDHRRFRHQLIPATLSSLPQNHKMHSHKPTHALSYREENDNMIFEAVINEYWSKRRIWLICDMTGKLFLLHKDVDCQR